MDVESLTQSQRDALDQLQVVMNGGDPEVAIGVLSSVDWDVQRAAEIIFDQGAPAPPARTQPEPPVRESFELDDSEQGLLGGSHGREFNRVNSSSSSALVARPIRAIVGILTLPLRFLAALLRFLFRVLRIPMPQFTPFTSLTFSYRPLGPGSGRDTRYLDAKSAAERWVRSLEEETGAVCVSHRRSRQPPETQTTSASGADVTAGSSGLTARSGTWEGETEADTDMKLLPDFYIGSYEDFVRTCQRDMKIGCVILVSEEHDDVPEFKRSTLVDPAFVQLVTDNGILVWGGDIRDREPWSAAQKLQATTYPFVAFIALQPRRTPGNNSSSTPTDTILSRHQGPSIPSTSGPTAAQTLVTHLSEQLLPRVTPFLARLRTQAVEKERERASQTTARERERALRAEQDRAFEESKRRDAERIRRVQEEERRAKEERAREEEAAQLAEEERGRRMLWRRWARRALIVREPRPGGEPDRGKTIRIGVRMPDGRRVVRFFGEADQLVALYAYVDSLFVPPGTPTEGDPQAPPSGNAIGEEALVEEMQRSGKSPEKWWGFQLVLAYPRKEISWEAGRKIGEVDALKGGGQIVVEPMADESIGKGKQKAQPATGDDGSDGYKTESDEE
ncbi:hypothetical protein CERSUDRAFT_118799 [Gelatoporia subvermispora B]|uniref:UBX domain-containing protein n=1 Tax=Ceriporiopsis subvermispora (strain B) TaxID=914234 RepID=M2PAE5_CERS8|nr:hypothetical protein CERSUDRAFT_118799 [Gelatoporia subvermispora B]